ncbi:MAG: RNA pseudouridine synthase [Firmicutes bacterium]|nr:RNA pseudouridine synthase [Bacillota bacterium]MCL1953327.1 RNA pseudouridine synthase [Bacillota bacterium]
MEIDTQENLYFDDSVEDIKQSQQGNDEFEPIVLHEDNHILVVVKPQNLLSQGDDTGDKDLLNLLKNYLKVKYKKPGAVYLGLVHRLDRPTGGVMVFARTSKAAERLSNQMKDGDISKKYLAVVQGMPKFKIDRLVHYLKKDSQTNTVVQAPALTEGAKRCILDYKVLESSGTYSLIDVKLVTGRSHQIRAQFKAIGNPLVGDQRYGGPKSRNLALWAYELKFIHPTTKLNLVFRVFPPEHTVFRHFNIERYINVYRPE